MTRPVYAGLTGRVRGRRTVATTVAFALFAALLMVVTHPVSARADTTPSLPSGDFTLTLSASDLGIDPTYLRTAFNELSGEMASDNLSLSDEVKKDVAQNGVDTSAWVETDLSMAATSDGTGLTFTIPAAEVQTSQSWWQEAIGIALGTASLVAVRGICISIMTVSGIGAATIPLVCTPLGAATGAFFQSVWQHYWDEDLGTSTAWTDILIKTVAAALGGFLWEKYASPFFKTSLPAYWGNLGRWLQGRAPGIQRWFGATAYNAVFGIGEIWIEMEELLPSRAVLYDTGQPVATATPTSCNTATSSSGTDENSGLGNATSTPSTPSTGSAASPPSTTPGTSSTTCNVMVVGDSISNGYEGDDTWRYRLWQWAQQENLPLQFVGPLTGTRKQDPGLPPQEPQLGEQTSATSNFPVSEFTGAYATDASSAFVNGGSAHYAMWGRQLGQDVPTIGPVMVNLMHQNELPGMLLVELGFNDIGWLGAGADLVSTMKQFIDNARAVNPNVEILLANVYQRTTLGSANPNLGARISAYDSALYQAIPTWNTVNSPVALVDLDAAMGCDPTATTCATTYDGLHPNPLGEYRIAGAFGDVLHYQFGFGSGALQVPLSEPDRSLATPSGLQFDGTQQGVTVTWPAVFGAHNYDVEWCDVTNGAACSWTDSPTGATGNRYDLGWQFTNEPYDGHTYEVRVRADSGDLKSAWSDPVTGVAHPTTAQPPATLTATASAASGSIDVAWTAPTGSYTGSIDRYALWIYDQDTPQVFSRIIGYSSSTFSAHVTGLTPGQHYEVFMDDWNAAGEGKPNIFGTVVPN